MGSNTSLQRLATASLETIWMNPNDQKAAKKIQEKIAKIYGDQEKVGIISGLLAGIASACGSIPTVGGLVGAPFAAAANYYGAVAGIDVGFHYADQCDSRQDLYKLTQTQYSGFASRLLDRYVKASQVDIAGRLEKTYAGKFKLLSAEKIQRLKQKKIELEGLAKNILEQLGKTEKRAVELLWGGQLRKRTEEEKANQPVKVSKSQGKINKIKREILAITAPLKEVCEYIQGSRWGFSFENLHNERDTMKVRCEAKLTNILMSLQEAERAKEMQVMQTKFLALEKDNEKLKKRASKHKSRYKALLNRVESLEQRIQKS